MTNIELVEFALTSTAEGCLRISTQRVAKVCKWVASYRSFRSWNQTTVSWMFVAEFRSPSFFENLLLGEVTRDFASIANEAVWAYSGKTAFGKKVGVLRAIIRAERQELSMQNIHTRHPAKIGETYAQHFVAATWFGTRLLWGGMACMLHGFFPFLFERAGSKTIRSLNQELDRSGRAPDRQDCSLADPDAAR